jgi:hypothetical protein
MSFEAVIDSCTFLDFYNYHLVAGVDVPSLAAGCDLLALFTWALEREADVEFRHMVESVIPLLRGDLYALPADVICPASFSPRALQHALPEDADRLFHNAVLRWRERCNGPLYTVPGGRNEGLIHVPSMPAGPLLPADPRRFAAIRADARMPDLAALYLNVDSAMICGGLPAAIFNGGQGRGTWSDVDIFVYGPTAAATYRRITRQLERLYTATVRHGAALERIAPRLEGYTLLCTPD